ncbi:hypothetical protein NK356_15705 [Chryseobacterium sp. S0630]|uniref:hypothetical protein n=1 Tax=Chryseobacterium sp. S0630 TaxID=2957803 RepID=UPI00209FD465|nr:hypothetical protein [Chryseobacterium sp. S0630]MCP1300620.1 hypothetical protein [Chryseobacterium sp. S0630]
MMIDLPIDYNSILDTIVENVQTIPFRKRYWLIRTNSGTFYDTFKENNFVGLDHSQISLRDLSRLRARFHDDFLFLSAIKESVADFYTPDLETGERTKNDRSISLIANQIFKFYTQVKKGDLVIIPSYSSSKVAFGIVKETYIAEFSEEELDRIDVAEQFLNKRVEWIEDFDRVSLDPNIYKMFTAHQAITEVGKYADVIERTLQDFFVLENEAHLIINVQKEDGINARSLFGLGYNFLEILEDVIYALDIKNVSSNDFEVEVNINSPGKIDLKSRIKKGTVLAFLTLAVFGGGYESKGYTLKSDGLPGLIKAITEAINEYKDREQDRAMQKAIFDQYKDKLNVKEVDDMLKIMKQVDDNQDKPK